MSSPVPCLLWIATSNFVTVRIIFATSAGGATSFRMGRKSTKRVAISSKNRVFVDADSVSLTFVSVLHSGDHHAAGTLAVPVDDTNSVST